MSITQKMRVVLLLTVVGSVLFLTGISKGMIGLGVLGAGIALLASAYSLALNCPYCGFPAGKMEIPIGRFKFSAWAIGTYKTCRRCGKPLNTPPSE